MEKYGPKTPLPAFRTDALHRNAMCEALAADDARYLPIAEQAAATMASIDAKSAEVRAALDLLVRSRAVERARKLSVVEHYDQARRDLAAEAVRLVPVLLPTPPSALKKVGITKARALVEQAVANLRLPAMPAEVRDEHMPVLETHLVRMTEADRAEDEAGIALASLRAALALFRADRERERVEQYAEFVKITGARAAADEFFLSRRSGRADAADETEDEETPAETGTPTA